VRPWEAQAARAALTSRNTLSALVDFVHTEIHGFDMADWDGLYERSAIVAGESFDVRVLARRTTWCDLYS
jgi:hypothetical protein